MTVLLQKEISKLKKMLLKMGSIVEENLKKAVIIFEQKNQDRALVIIEIDEQIDQMEIDIEEECLKILALYQPVANDLRFIVAVLKINNHLERIHDLVVNIAERAIDLSNIDNITIPFDLFAMADVVQEMVTKSLDSLIKSDSGQAIEVCKLDDLVDDMHKLSYTLINKSILKKPDLIDALIQNLSISRYMERIADLASNIAEDVFYMVEGEIVRHQLPI